MGIWRSSSAAWRSRLRCRRRSGESHAGPAHAGAETVQSSRPNASKTRVICPPTAASGTSSNHPAFAGFGRLLLPWDDRAYDENMRLGDIGSLLPYHSHVDPETVVGALNRMIDDVSKRQAGLLRLLHRGGETGAARAKRIPGCSSSAESPARPLRSFLPGGGFSYVGSIHEGFPLCGRDQPARDTMPSC